MKIGRNSLCPCGSGKKYKHCCLNKQLKYVKDGVGVNVSIRGIVKDKGYDDKIADVLCNLMDCMRANGLRGACHAMSSVVFVALSELGYNPVLCIGEVRDVNPFDHSWVELDGQIIDLACAMTCSKLSIKGPVIFGVDCYTGEFCSMQYGIYYTGLDYEAKFVLNTSFNKYMDMYPHCESGLWGVVSIVLGRKIDVSQLHITYGNVERKYVCCND